MGDLDLQGRHFVLTGATSGIGKATATALARRGAQITLACRSQEKAVSLARELEQANSSCAARFLQLELSDLASVRKSAEELVGRAEPIHVLINNAGLAGHRGATADGFELAFGVNHLGHFLFTSLVVDALVDAGSPEEPARVVAVSSDAHFQAAGIDFDALRQPTHGFTAMREYAVSKLCNLLHMQELARRLGDRGDRLKTYAVHPGVIASDIWKRVPWPVEPLMKLFMRSTEEGSRTSVYCATSEEVAEQSGNYYVDCRKRPCSPVATPELSALLWDKSEEYCGLGALR